MALETSTIWSSICPSFNCLPFSETWLKIAPKIPFHLYIYDPVLASGLYPEFPCKVMRLFSSVSHRWKSLSLELNSRVAKEFLSILQEHKEDPLPIEELKLEFTEAFPTRDANVIPGIVDLLPSLPCLTQLHWETRTPFMHPFEPLAIPWSKFKDIKFNHLSTVEEVVSYLIRCTSATSVNFQCSRDFPTVDRPLLFRPSGLSGDTQPFPLPLLTSLILCDICHDPTTILEYLSLPSLQNLSIHVTRHNVPTLSKFLTTTPLLDKLTITVRSDTDEDLVAYFLDPILCRIPCVVFIMFEAEDRTLEILEQYAEAVNTLPALICWRITLEGQVVFGRNPNMAMGWDNDPDSNRYWVVAWTYKNGWISLAPTYCMRNDKVKRWMKY